MSDQMWQNRIVNSGTAPANSAKVPQIKAMGGRMHLLNKSALALLETAESMAATYFGRKVTTWKSYHKAASATIAARFIIKRIALFAVIAAIRAARSHVQLRAVKGSLAEQRQLACGTAVDLTQQNGVNAQNVALACRVGHLLALPASRIHAFFVRAIAVDIVKSTTLTDGLPSLFQGITTPFHTDRGLKTGIVLSVKKHLSREIAGQNYAALSVVRHGFGSILQGLRLRLLFPARYVEQLHIVALGSLIIDILSAQKHVNTAYYLDWLKVRMSHDPKSWQWHGIPSSAEYAGFARLLRFIIFNHAERVAAMSYLI